MPKTGKYIYGIINSNKDETFGAFGITTGEVVYTISYQDISAIVSDTEIVDYKHTFKDVLARLLVRHQKTIEKIMHQGYTVIPVRLGTFAVDEPEVKDILYKGYNLIKEIFVKIDNRIEMDLAATWSDFQAVLKEAGQDEGIKEFKEKLLASPERVTPDDQIKVGLMVKDYVGKKNDAYANQIEAVLRRISEAVKVHQRMSDEMAANFAFLIDKNKHKEFEKKIDELDKRFDEKMNFRCIGPLPFYSFYTLEVQRMDFNEIDWARKRLGLGDSAARKEIDKARQREALLSHPDRNPDLEEKEIRFDEVNRAYKILLDYCRALEQVSKEKDYVFSGKKFENNAILIKLRD
jgi:hypothetical protein